MKKPRIAVIDYGMGNLRSVGKALEFAGAEAIVTSSPSRIRSAEAAVFPGVGSFGPAIKYLRKTGLDEAILDVINRGKPFLGLCLGFQLLFDTSVEEGSFKGLGVIPGKVVKFRAGGDRRLKIPHMGWNSLKISGKEAAYSMFSGIPDNSYFYFVHSYYAVSKDASAVAGRTGYGIDFCSAVKKGNIWGCQFHPEKSSAFGLKLLGNFLKEVKKCS